MSGIELHEMADQEQHNMVYSIYPHQGDWKDANTVQMASKLNVPVEPHSFGAALLDINEPWKVLYRTEPYLLSPQTLYECVGDVPNVVFPCATLADADTGRITVYYGGADTVTCIAFTQIDELIGFIKENSVV